MVEILENQNSKKYPKEPVDKKLLLSSLHDFAPEGVGIEIEKLLKPKLTSKNKIGINTILSITGNMPKIRQYVLDEDGEKIEYLDEESGEKRFKIKISDGTFCKVFFNFYAKLAEGETDLDENTRLLITPGTSSYSVFREGFIAAGLLPEDLGIESFITTFKEMEEVLTGFEFIGKYAHNNKGYEFDYLKAQRIRE